MNALAALYKWQETQAQLETALDNFFEACTTLRLACSEASPEVKNVVERLCDRLDRLGEIDRKMVTARAITLGIRNASTAVVPVTKLPHELLIKVFAHCVDARSRGRELYPYPIDNIARVCSRWRRIALNTPSLWSLVIADYDPTHRRPSHIPTATRLRLERSVNTPLNLCVHSTLRQHGVEQLVPVIRPHLPCVSRLVFRSVDVGLIDALFPQGQIPCVALSALCLSNIQGESQLLGDHDWSIWPAIHDLQELELVYLCYSICPSLEQLARMLAKSPNLQTLRIGLQSIDFNLTSIDQSDIHLPALRRLEIGTLADYGMRELLSMLRLSHPKLNIALELPHRHNDEIILPIKMFLQRCDVAAMTFRPCSHSVAPGFEHYFDSLPQCHTMTLEFLHRTVRFDLQFTLEKLSALRVLIIFGGEVDDSSWMDIIRISETRRLARIAFSGSVKFWGMGQEQAETCDWANRIRQRVGEVVFQVDGFDD